MSTTRTVSSPSANGTSIIQPGSTSTTLNNALDTDNNISTRQNDDKRSGNAKTLADLTTPAFVVNRHAFARNCQAILDMARERSFHLRPHIKTHKTLEGIRLQGRGTGSRPSELVTGFVASTIPEVELLVRYVLEEQEENGSWNGSILFGVPISANKLPALCALQEKLMLAKQTQAIKSNHKNNTEPETKRSKLDDHTSKDKDDNVGSYCNIHLLIDHPQQIQIVQEFLDAQKKESFVQTWSVFVKLDTGYHRAGITCDERGIDLVDLIVSKSPRLKLAGLYSHWYVNTSP